MSSALHFFNRQGDKMTLGRLQDEYFNKHHLSEDEASYLIDSCWLACQQYERQFHNPIEAVKNIILFERKHNPDYSDEFSNNAHNKIIRVLVEMSIDHITYESVNI